MNQKIKTDDITKEIEQMLIEAWNKFLDYYNEKAPKYLESWLPKLNGKEAEESHWICWNECDLMFHVGRFFYEALKKKEEREEKKEDSKFSNIEIHFEKNINSTNFPDYEFAKRLEKVNKNLKMKRGPKVDIIVTYENKNCPFLLCAEMKYFHSAPNYHQKIPPTDLIAHDIEKLKAIRDCEIAERVIFMLFDDYYWLTDEKITKEIEDKLRKIKGDDRIEVLYCSSKAKLEINK